MSLLPVWTFFFCSGFQVLDSRFCLCNLGFRIPVASAIPDSLSCSPDPRIPRFTIQIPLHLCFSEKQIMICLPRHKGRDPFNKNFRKYRSKTQWIGKVSKKLVHLLRWTTFPGRSGWHFGWMDRAQIFLCTEETSTVLMITEFAFDRALHQYKYGNWRLRV